MKIYLAGPINDCSDSEAKDWRQYVKDVLRPDKNVVNRYSFIDPMDRDYRGVEDYFFPVIVEKDKEDIQRTDVVLAHCPTPSVGTSMEIFYANSLGKRVITVVPPDARVSPWLRVHSEIVLPDFGMAIQYIKRLG